MNGECTRFLELWNNVFIQYNLFEDGRLRTPAHAKHVDTGMGFRRIVAMPQDRLNYKADLFGGRAGCGEANWPAKTRSRQMYADFTPYRVICDHAPGCRLRSLADGVVPERPGATT